jgi:hypothetical protein
VVQRLEHLGFNVARAAYGMTLLKRAEKRVMVPDVESIESEMMEAILRSAGLSEAEFFGRSRSGIYRRQTGFDAAPTGEAEEAALERQGSASAGGRDGDS